MDRRLAINGEDLGYIEGGDIIKVSKAVFSELLHYGLTVKGQKALVASMYEDFEADAREELHKEYDGDELEEEVQNHIDICMEDNFSGIMFKGVDIIYTADGSSEQFVARCGFKHVFVEMRELPREFFRFEEV